MDIENLQYEFQRTEAQIAKLNIQIATSGNHSSATKSKEELEKLKGKEEKLIERLNSLLVDTALSD